MGSYNKVILLGNLTRDPQLSYLPSQTAVVEVGLATNRTYKKQDGTQGKDTCFVDCQMFGKRAEVINKYFHKGDPILVEGRLKFDSWQSQDGSKRSKLLVFIENFQFVGGSGQRGADPGQGQGAQSAQGGAPGGAPVGSEPGIDEDIPF